MPMKSFIREAQIHSRRKESLGVLASGTFTANGNTPDINVEHITSARFWIRVTAVSGSSPTLAIHIDGKHESTGDYESIASRTNITSTGGYLIGSQVDNLVFRFIRVRWVLGGTTPSFTFTVTGQAMG
jgi:hypothetical protein